MAKQTPVPVTGIWLRKLGEDLEVLAEINGLWHKVITENADGCISHIVEPLGIRKAPLDDLEKSAA